MTRRVTHDRDGFTVDPDDAAPTVPAQRPPHEDDDPWARPAEHDDQEPF